MYYVECDDTVLVGTWIPWTVHVYYSVNALFQVVKSLLCLLHAVMKIYKKCKSCRLSVLTLSEQCTDSEDSLLSQEEQHLGTSLKILQTGLQLLHLMSQFDMEFANRHLPVQHKYVQLICGLTRIFRHRDNKDNESECKLQSSL